jgi:DNA-binding response OmpR family regulator
MHRPAAPPKVLIIDDDRILVEIATAHLRQAGYAVEAAFDALQGLRLAMRNRPDLVVLDLKMPAGGGMHVLEGLSRSARTASIPVVVITASDSPGVEGAVRGKGARAFLTKPFDGSQLVAAAAELVGPAAAG